jgi:hypothetical protein
MSVKKRSPGLIAMSISSDSKGSVPNSHIIVLFVDASVVLYDAVMKIEQIIQEMGFRVKRANFEMIDRP